MHVPIELIAHIVVVESVHWRENLIKREDGNLSHKTPRSERGCLRVEGSEEGEPTTVPLLFFKYVKQHYIEPPFQVCTLYTLKQGHLCGHVRMIDHLRETSDGSCTDTEKNTEVTRWQVMGNRPTYINTIYFE